MVQKYCLVLFFPCLPLAQTQNLGPVCYAYFGCFIDPNRHILHTQSVYNKTQNLCLGSTKLCLVMTRTHLGVVWLGSQGKKKQTKTFVLFTIMTYFWFNILPLKAPKVKNKSATCAFSILHFSGFLPLPCLEDKFSLKKETLASNNEANNPIKIDDQNHHSQDKMEAQKTRTPHRNQGRERASPSWGRNN
jgi:hypothetical protein